jgi:O-antigen ligase
MMVVFVLANIHRVTNTIKYATRQMSTADDQTSVSTRKVWWENAIEQCSRTYGVGVGIGGLQQYLEGSGKPPHAHSVYLDALGELGILGLALTLIIHFLALRTFLHALKHSRSEYYRRLLLAYLGGFISLLLSICINYGHINYAIWWYMAVGFVLARCANRAPASFKLSQLPYYRQGQSMVLYR